MSRYNLPLLAVAVALVVFWAGFVFLAVEVAGADERATTAKHRCDRACKTQTLWNKRKKALPDSMIVTLRRLRGCETRGIPYPQNYRYRGHHFGAYQYDVATWREAGGSGVASDASAQEQDVRTARFYPTHRGRWACKA